LLRRFAPRNDGSWLFEIRIRLSSPGLTGRSSIPETAVIEPKSRGVLDTPLEPVIGLAEGETRWRGMTTLRLGDLSLATLSAPPPRR